MYKRLTYVAVFVVSLHVSLYAADTSKFMTPIIMYLLDGKSLPGTSDRDYFFTPHPTNSSGGSSSSSGSTDPKYTYEYEGMPLYAQSMDKSGYILTSVTDADYNALSLAQKRILADKLLATLYYGMPLQEFESAIASHTFISNIWNMVHTERNNLSAIETRLDDNGNEDQEFYFHTWPSGTKEVSRILARFYVMPYLDRHYVDFWSAYVLTSTIMFSPAYELESSHSPNIDRVYGALVRNQRDDCSIEYLTFLHMTSDDNWRRFRSPEDNGREMMEIYLLDFEDGHVPIAAQALKNWSLNRDNDTLVIALNENTIPLNLFNTTITDGFDFYRELTKSDAFIPGVTARLVDIYFPTYSGAQKQSIVNQIVQSDPQTWQDILLQIVFSHEYLFNSDKPKSAEELFFSQSKKTYFAHRRGFFSYFARALSEMHQAPMKYKLGKYSEVPLDTQSFLNYHKMIREWTMVRYKNSWSWGWHDTELLFDGIFGGYEEEEDPYEMVVQRLVDYLFLSTVSRRATDEERSFFASHFIDDDGEYKYEFELFPTDRDSDPLDDRRNGAITILDYLSRLSELYRYQKVQ